MTERSFNLVVPLAHEATAMRTTDTAGVLTLDCRRAYIPARQQTTDDGLGGPVMECGESCMVLPCGYFFALVRPLNGRTGRGGRKACRLHSPVRQPRPVPPTPLGGEVCGSFKRTEECTMSNDTQGAPASSRTTARHPFFRANANGDLLFDVRAGIPLIDALEMASCYLVSARDLCAEAAERTTGENPDHAWGSYYLLELACAVLQGAISAVHADEKTRHE